MFGTTGFQELVLLMLLIAVLSLTGLWPRIVRGLRELRGDETGPSDAAAPSAIDIDVCYKLLGLTPSASWQEVETAYRQKAKIHHPDHGGDADTMRALNEAYAKVKGVRGR